MANACEGTADEQCVKGRKANGVPIRQANERLAAVDRVKGLGIALVVWGHLATSATPGLPTWFYISVTTIYSFHMPLFMYLSGFTFFFSKSNDIFRSDPLWYVRKRINRLIVPFVTIAMIIVIGKYFVKNGYHSISFINFFHSIKCGLVKIIENDQLNPALSLWYLLVLFVYSILFPILYRILRYPTISLCVIGLALWSFELPEKYYIARIAQYFVFFSIGGLLAAHRDRILPMISAHWILALFLFASSTFLTLGSEWALLISGLASIPAIHGLFMQKFWDNERVFLFLGNNSMAIYLLNTIAIGLAQIAYTRYLPYTGAWFLIYSPLAFLFGLLMPIAVRYILSTHKRLQPIKKYID